MKTEMVSRPIQVYSMPLLDGVTILHPELAVVKFGPSKTVDLGILCYSQRTIPTTKNRSGGRKVVLESLSPSRIQHVRRLLTHTSTIAQVGGIRMPTLHDHYSRLVVFVTWADMNQWQDVLSCEGAARPAIRAYVEHVRDRVARNEMSLNGGAKQQNSVVQVLGDFLGIEGLGRGLNLLKRDPNTEEVTVPPSEEAQGRVLSLCDSLFNGICDLVLNKAPFPHASRMPSYLGFPDNQLWVFPGISWFKTPAMVAERPGHAGYDYTLGRMATPDELKVQYPTLVYRWSEVFARAKKQMEAANDDFSHSSRWQIAKQALNVYIIVFLAATGMNWSQAMALSWSEDFEITPSTQGFRTVKWRARGRLVSFELPISFLPTFKRFLAIRTFLLEGWSCDYLFFTRLKASDAPGPILSSLHRAYAMLRRIDPALSPVMPREWRAAKSDWLVRNADPSTAALVLQNSERTVLKHYAQGSETLHHEEMSRYLSEVASPVLAAGESIEMATSRAVGVCSSYGTPAPIAVPGPVKPDCNSAEGCLFCDKLKVHADDTDTRKLLSCRYAINLTAPLSDSEEAFNELLQPILTKIDGILSDIAARDQEMVDRVRKEVDEDGELDPYWAGKVEMLMTLGL